MAQIADPRHSTSTDAPALGLIKRHPVLAYFILTFAISWGGVVLVIGGYGGFPTTSEDITRLFPVAYLATVAGPLLIATTVWLVRRRAT